MTWVWLVLAAWLALAVVCALVIGRSIRAADRVRLEAANFVIDEAPAPPPRTPHPTEASAARDLTGTELPRRSGPPSAVQNCVTAGERSVSPEPTLPHPRS